MTHPHETVDPTPAIGSDLWRAMYALVRRLTGVRLQARVRFLDVGVVGGEFEASSFAARRIVPPAIFDLVEHEAGRVAVSILALDHRRIDRMSPYRELVLALPVRYRAPKKGEQEGHFVFQMPVTTEEARWGGVELYGFPKILADVRLEREGRAHVCTLTHDQQHALTLRVREEATASPSRELLRSFTLRDDRRVIGSTFDIRGERERCELPGGATLMLGEHPIADQLRRLEISSESRSHFVMPHAYAVLSKGRVLGRVPREGMLASALEPSPGY
jgi:hypothetical protein